MSILKTPTICTTLSLDVTRTLSQLLDFAESSASQINPTLYELARADLHHAVSQFVLAANAATSPARFRK